MTRVFLLISLYCCAAPMGYAQLLNGDFSAGKTNFVSDYTFDVFASYLPGYYTVQTNSQKANSGFAEFGDHTSGTGRMLLVNGSTASNKVVWAETIPVVPNAAYVFSAWATSASTQSPPVLRFSANAEPLGPDLHLSAEAGQWQGFVATWNSGTATQVTLAVIDTNQTSVGNDFALDDLEFTPATNVVSNVRVYPAVELGWDSQPGSIFQVQYSTRADPEQWMNLGPPVESTGAATSFLNSTRDQPAKFYRVLRIK